MTGVTFVENEIEHCAMPSMPCATLNPGNFLKTGKVLTERVHAYDARMFLQLSAGFGRVSMPGLVSGTPVGPSPIPHRWLDGVVCRELTHVEVKTYVRKFANSAEIAQKAGFDGVEVHAVHEGYLLDQFAIAMFNQRTDEYGGSLENRLRFATEIVQAIKARCGADYPDDPGQFQWLIENDRWSSGHVRDALAKLIGPLHAQRCGNAARQQLIGAVRAYYNTRSREKYSFSPRGPRAEAALEKERSTPVDIEIDRFVRQAIRSGFLHKDEIPGNADPEFAKVVAATIEVGAFCPPVKVDRNDDTPLSAAPKKSVPDLAVAVHRHPKRNILKRT